MDGHDNFSAMKEIITVAILGVLALAVWVTPTRV
jgi:hypothetical protein